MSPSGGPNFLGGKHAPFVMRGDPSRNAFKARAAVPPSEIPAGRDVSRQELRRSLDRLTRIPDAGAEDPTAGFDSFYQQGLNLVTSPQAQAAFDISKESDAVRDQYGRTPLGQRLLLCPRLVQVGVSFVSCSSGGWDHHKTIFKSYKGSQMAALD